MKRILPDIKINLAPASAGGLFLANPVMAASGTFGYGTEYAELVDIQRLGAIVCKGTTFRPKEGNPQPRLMETPCGVLNSVGLENIGVEAVICEKAPAWQKWPVPVLVNIAGETVQEYARIAALLDDVPGVSGLEVNISCPNVVMGGAEFGVDSRLAAEVTSAVREATSLPLIVKLTPGAADICEIALAVEAAGADAVCLINTVKGMAIDVGRGGVPASKLIGGLSGPAVKPIALYMVYKVAGVVHIPVVGCGGISCAADALEFLMAGASAVQVGTAGFSHPRAGIDTLEGITDFMTDRGISKLSDIIGSSRD